MSNKVNIALGIIVILLVAAVLYSIYSLIPSITSSGMPDSKTSVNTDKEVVFKELDGYIYYVDDATDDLRSRVYQFDIIRKETTEILPSELDKYFFAPAVRSDGVLSVAYSNFEPNSGFVFPYTAYPNFYTIDSSELSPQFSEVSIDSVVGETRRAQWSPDGSVLGFIALSEGAVDKEINGSLEEYSDINNFALYLVTKNKSVVVVDGVADYQWHSDTELYLLLEDGMYSYDYPTGLLSAVVINSDWEFDALGSFALVSDIYKIVFSSPDVAELYLYETAGPGGDVMYLGAIEIPDGVRGYNLTAVPGTSDVLYTAYTLDYEAIVYSLNVEEQKSTELFKTNVTGDYNLDMSWSSNKFTR